MCLSIQMILLRPPEDLEQMIKDEHMFSRLSIIMRVIAMNKPIVIAPIPGADHCLTVDIMFFARFA